MVARPPAFDLSLQDFLEGVFCVFAFREQRAVDLIPGVFEEALGQTFEELEKQMARERIRVAFRRSPKALSQRGSVLVKALASLQREGVIRLTVTPPGAQMLLTPPGAYGRLSAMHVPIGFLERAAKALQRRLQVNRIRRSLAGLATR
ncbi:MAG TPA: hypothetical protein VI818_07535, partial [Candidatus Thermoplasmatota archaeon]|nr:hypothetical protein [Candidatus Thermoplasmatota archaeon]